MFNEAICSRNEEFKKHIKKSRNEQQKAFLIAILLYCAPVIIALVKRKFVNN
ncbi:hypothetical protein PNEG_01937 [Pneumocystis murina B123]|uniref:Uncharacterized protein n=1 Tax=Pneumocystis murina (strain B123) TaxID=1069680 RepID=M7NR87_PNEMU|nr:hypothetical protein PNEG_01937 [Pneumocystis murina B123]EMR09752.1 hypothetical protein PNEG_01937 [Pneumocystis murina B123]